MKVVYEFAYTHGASPVGALIQGSDGNFYGTTTEAVVTGGASCSN